MEVLDAISDYKNFNREKIKNSKDKKAVEHGKFKDKIILEES